MEPVKFSSWVELVQQEGLSSFEDHAVACKQEHAKELQFWVFLHHLLDTKKEILHVFLGNVIGLRVLVDDELFLLNIAKLVTTQESGAFNSYFLVCIDVF